MKIGRKKLEETPVMPLRFYEEDYIKFEDLEVGDVVVANVFELKENKVFLWVGDNLAVMRLNDYSDAAPAQNASLVVSLMGRNVLARVKAKEGRVIVLERKSIVNKTIEILKTRIFGVIDATIEWRTNYGIFVDIGNGVSSLIYANEVSISWHNFMKDFKKGQTVKVRILGYIPEKNQFIISRKKAYEKKNFEKNEIIEVVCSTPLRDGTGIYVEYDPGNSGIMDIPYGEKLSSYAEGKKVLVIVKKTTDVGFRCAFWWHV